MKFRSKFGLELLIFLAIVFGFCAFNSNNPGKVILVLFPVILFIVFLLYSIRYEISGDQLIVYSLLSPKIMIDIQSINTISETNNPLSSPAASLDRLEIKYGNNYDYILISPINTEDFIKLLQAKNPDIQVKLHKKANIFSKLAL